MDVNLRCKPGDMAVIIRDTRADFLNLGAVITCVNFCRNSLGESSWTFTTTGRTIIGKYDDVAECIPDVHLQPLPPKVEDIVTEDSLVIT